jgi:hypothetical protein|tara:strand:- start:760 stop:990 length:231 start_codon:yes stop_codon:yes gene_type:complete
MATYVILDTTEITDEDSAIDFSQLLNRNSAMLRYSLDDSKAVVKYNGDQPSFLDGKTTYAHQEILVEMAKSDWTEE